MKRFIVIIQIIVIIGLILSLSGCNSVEESSKEPVNTTSKEEVKVDNSKSQSTYENIKTAEQEKADKLAGTCVRGLSCTSPTCGSWSDINKDGACDEGESK